MRVGITGTQGFVGGHTRTALLRQHEVIDLDKWMRDPSINLPQNLALDWVLHCAAKTSISESFVEQDITISTNLALTKRALSFAETSGASFIFVSSYVYGIPYYLPIDEEHPIAALNPYMESKIQCEGLVRASHAHAGIPVVVLRPFSLFGPNMKRGRLFGDLSYAAATNTPLIVRDENAARDYLYIDDFCDLLNLVISHPYTSPPACEVFNVGFGMAMQNKAVATAFRRLSSGSMHVSFEHQPRTNDVPTVCADNSKVKATYGWTPVTTLETGIRAMLAEGLTRRRPRT